MVTISLSFLLFTSSCSKTGIDSSQLPATATNTVNLPAAPTLSFTDTPVPPTMTSTTVILPTETITTTPTMVPSVNQYISFYVEYEQYSRIILEFNVQAGSYYGIGTSSNGQEINYSCVWYALPSTSIACSGAAIPVQASVDFRLYSDANGEEVYRNTFTYRGRVLTPVGMSCEAEPQWGGRIPAHQLEMGCFAVTCFQNGGVYYGNNNTCETPWPFDWDFVHPLNPPRQ